MKNRFFLYATLLSATALVACENTGTAETPFAPDLAFSETGRITAGVDAGSDAEPYEITISRTIDLAQSVAITLGVDETLVPAGKQLMAAEFYDLPTQVSLPADESSVAFDVTFDALALKEEMGDDADEYVLPVTILSVEPGFELNKARTSVVIGLDLASPTVTVDTGQTFVLTFGTEKTDPETVKFLSRVGLEFDFEKLSYEVAPEGVDEYNSANDEERVLLPASAYSFGEHSYLANSRRLSHLLTIIPEGLAEGDYVLPLAMSSDDEAVEIVQNELCFVAVSVVAGVVGVVVNGDFSTEVGLSQNWGKDGAVVGEWRYTGGWNTGGATVSYDPTGGFGGSPCVVIATKAGMTTDVMISQKVTGLNPEKAYKVTAKIKTENITKGRGANIAEGSDIAPASNGVTGTKGWTSETLYVPDPVGGEVQISLRLGYNSADSDGKAWFDNVEISEDTDMYIRQSTHVKFMVPRNKVPASVTDADIDVWLGNLDEAYLAYKILFSGRVPWDGIRMKIRSANIPAWAYAGNPIQWNTNYITSELSSIKNNGDWSFGILHEIGHNFASHIGSANYAWNWDEEVFANFRMAYVLQNVSGARIRQQNRNYGANIIDYYKLSYDSTIGRGLASNGDGIQYTLLRIVKEFGWEPVIEAFDHLYELAPNTPSGSNNWSKWEKFNFFLDTIDDYVPAGESVRDTYTAQELSLIQSGLTE